ncbi:hypothetical protein SERLA73DRAFT_123276 [Serpula lacrymans var. lacrymans S7.3]|uniref:Geranylgeranyl pyrophosphate synthetase n=2 Tax=Serpula lacrymans var. lacrymans TaxID=341189 RepID=F8Q0K2_SERL3|nr:uncharacterized protein SERLADRAFT_370321 [Serpula lacrymans var. lacrymans S7.9]EGN97831.1 hypothetical protein SERLA73DRAFT_123276 [Serpula lacrymans var. lacrymans S7.3]EGO23423.1 hypothetical protein SERLADRAFT_370321 [Serpula lacrymans var. lacrymans S7.9]
MYEGLVTASVATIEPPSITDDSDVQITDVKDLGSYNWAESPVSKHSRSPPIWVDRAPPFTIQRDTGLFYVDQNGYRMANAPLLPLFKAVDIIQKDNGDPALDWSSVDIISDRNGLRKLVRWVKGSNEPKTFRIDMQLVGERTVLLSRWNTRLQEEVVGYGHNFERDCTRLAPGCEKSSGHHRIVNYNFEGLNMVVRFEVDACVSSPVTVPSRSSRADDLESAMAGLAIRPASKPASTVTEDGITICKVGTNIPRTSIVELTTLREGNLDQFVWDEVYFQLLLSQTPNHFLALHTRGTFSRVERRKLSTMGEKLEGGDKAQRVMKGMKRVLEAIQELAITHGPEGRLTLVCDGTELKVYSRLSDGSLLPKSILSRFD